MHELNIRGVPVSFPFEPYPCQVDYMDRVILALEKGKNAILESPTGTGKTLCLLCATIAWMEHQKFKEADCEVPRASGASTCSTGGCCGWGHKEAPEVAKPKVVYASRTHSQLSQVVHELSKTAYRPQVAIIGSRDRLCIHPGVISKESNTDKIHACRAKIRADKCGYYANFTKRRTNLEGIVDMEDLVAACRKERICPYYTARELSKTADFVLMPYNYILSPRLLEIHQIDLSNAILILDEAHNVPKACEEANSYDITTKNISSCSSDLQYLFKKLKEQKERITEDGDDGDDEATSEGFVEDLVNLKVLMDNFEEALDKIPLNELGQASKDGSFMLEFLEAIGVTHQTINTLVTQCEGVIAMLTQGEDTVRRSGNNIQHFLDFMKTVFGPSLEEQAQCFRVFVKEEEKQKEQSVWTVSTTGPTRRTTRTLSYWCFSAGYAMSGISLQVKSIILTSGTLRPLDSFAAELKVGFPVTLENPHVVGSEQVWMGVAVSGPDNITLNSSYAQRDSIDYRKSLGNSIVNLARVIPNGVLVFFSSYGLMSGCVDTWRNEEILQRIEQHKPVFFEPKQKSSLQDTMDAFYAKINDPEHYGAIFFAVCRGKVSEGLDFIDANGRAVIITGIPYPPRMDPKVKLKMQYLNAVKSLTMGLSGEQWYQQQATRAVNQAVGRVIRHSKDYGAIILCDERFSYSNNISQLPQWLVPYSQTFSSFGGLLRDLSRFFKLAETKFGPSKVPMKMSSVETDGPSTSVSVPIQARLLSRKEAMKGVQKASTVDVHVTSKEKPPSSLPKRRVEYEDKNKSLIHSLSSAEETKPNNQHVIRLHEPVAKELKNGPKLSDVIFQSASSSSGCSSSAQSKPAKKLIVKKRSTSTRVDQDAVSYISDLQKSLSMESYKDFKKSLALYKQDGNFSQLMITLREVFKYPSQHVLLHVTSSGFKRYVRQEHKIAFEEECFKLTGCSSGSTSDCEDFRFKVPKIPKAEPSFSANSDLSSSNNNCKSTEILLRDKLLTRTNTPTINEGNNKLQDSTGHTQLGEVPQNSHLTLQQFIAVEGRLPMRSATSGRPCSACHTGKANNPQQASCGHICCTPCWMDRFKKADKSCPNCGKRVLKLKRDLTKLYLS